jgi:hypothetical protein
MAEALQTAALQSVAGALRGHPDVAETLPADAAT